MKDLNNRERKRAQIALTYLTQKQDGKVKARTCYNGKPTREWLSKDDSASPTVSLESLFLTITIDAYEKRDVMTADIPNAFIQTPLEVIDGQDHVIMKITGDMVNMLMTLDSSKYTGYVVYENGKKVLYVKILRALYGMLISALLFYRKFKKDLDL